MASKPKKGAADEVAKLAARYGWKALLEAEEWAHKNYPLKSMGEKTIPKKTMSKKARKYTEGGTKKSKQFIKTTHRKMQRAVEKGVLRLPSSPKKYNGYVGGLPDKYTSVNKKNKSNKNLKKITKPREVFDTTKLF